METAAETHGTMAVKVVVVMVVTVEAAVVVIIKVVTVVATKVVVAVAVGAPLSITDPGRTPAGTKVEEEAAIVVAPGVVEITSEEVINRIMVEVL